MKTDDNEDLKRIVEITRESSDLLAKSPILSSYLASDQDGQIEITSLPTQEAEQVRRVLEFYAKGVVGDSFLDSASKKRRERKFLLRKTYEEVYESFIDACRLTLDQGTLNLSRPVLDTVVLRLFGVLAAAVMGQFRRLSGTGRQRNQLIRLTLEIDPAKLAPNWSKSRSFRRKMFVQWAKEFEGMEEQPGDMDILAMPQNMSLEDLLLWFRERFEWASAGLKRANELLSLEAQMLKRRNEVMSEQGGMLWAFMIALLSASSKKLLDILRNP